MLRLRPVRATDEEAARQAHAELAADAFDFLLDWQPDRPWAEHLDQLQRLRQGLDLPEDRVPATFLVAEVDGEIVGRVSIRFALNEWLRSFGGHIGYAVRPAFRRRGHAREMLRQALVVAWAEGVERALLTCDDDNVASAAVIERCGGVLENVLVEPGGSLKRRYWID